MARSGASRTHTTSRVRPDAKMGAETLWRGPARKFLKHFAAKKRRQRDRAAEVINESRRK